MRRQERGSDEHAPASHTDRAIGKRRDAGKHKCLRSKNLSAAWDDSGATRRGRQAPSLAIRIQKSRRSRVARPSSGADLLSRRGTPHCRTGDAPELRGYRGRSRHASAERRRRTRIWRISGQRAPTGLRPASVFPRVSRQSTSERSGASATVAERSLGAGDRDDRGVAVAPARSGRSVENAIARTCVVRAALLGERTDEERGGAEKGSPTLVAARGTRGAGARVTFGAVSTLIAEAKSALSGPWICMCRTASASSSRARRSGPESIGRRPPSESQLHDLGLALLVIAGQEDFQRLGAARRSWC